MNSKKKLIIAISSLCLVAVVAVIAVVAVMAAVNTKVTSGIKVTYKAYNVSATITGNYLVTSDGTGTATDLTTDGTNKTITFTKSDKTNNGDEKSFQAVTDITLENNEYLLLHYIITNTDNETEGETAITVTLTKSGTPSNMEVTYSTDNSTFNSTLNSGNAIEVAKGGTLNIYIKIEVDDNTESASFDGSFQFDLHAQAPTPSV